VISAAASLREGCAYAEPFGSTLELADAVERMLKGYTAFVLIDEQTVVFEKPLALARRLREGRHCVLLVQGGPGAGKSVVAVNLLARLLEMRLNARYVSKNAGPRAVYRAKLTGSLQKGEYDTCSAAWPASWAVRRAATRPDRGREPPADDQDHLPQGGREPGQGDHPHQQAGGVLPR
jgi:hypothetical protein